HYPARVLTCRLERVVQCHEIGRVADDLSTIDRDELAVGIALLDALLQAPVGGLVQVVFFGPHPILPVQSILAESSRNHKGILQKNTIAGLAAALRAC